MSTGEDPLGGGGGERAPTEDELRAAYEAQVRQIKVEHVLLEDVVTLVNLGMRRTGLVPGTEQERDPEQVKLAIDAVMAVMPLLERAAPAQVAQIRDALSQLQLAYVRVGGQGPGGAAGGGGDVGVGETAPGGAEPAPAGPAEQPPNPGEPGPAQRSGKLWVPGQ